MSAEHTHMTEAHRIALEYIFDKAIHKAKEACEHGHREATGEYLDIAKDADHILRKNKS